MQNTTNPPATAPATLLVACLCAQWCGTCNDYRALFEQLQTEFAQARFVWVDIEDETDLVDPIEVEDFPTVLIASGATPRFFGTVMPHVETLRRLLQSATEAGASTVADPEVAALTQRLQAI